MSLEIQRSPQIPSTPRSPPEAGCWRTGMAHDQLWTKGIEAWDDPGLGRGGEDVDEKNPQLHQTMRKGGKKGDGEIKLGEGQCVNGAPLSGKLLPRATWGPHPLGVAWRQTSSWGRAIIQKQVRKWEIRNISRWNRGVQKASNNWIMRRMTHVSANTERRGGTAAQ